MSICAAVSMLTHSGRELRLTKPIMVQLFGVEWSDEGIRITVESKDLEWRCSTVVSHLVDDEAHTEELLTQVAGELLGNIYAERSNKEMWCKLLRRMQIPRIGTTSGYVGWPGSVTIVAI